MIRLYIDNQRADMDSSTSLSISLSLASQTSTSSANRLSKSITIPATHLNRRLMEHCDHPASAVMFNHTPHTARVEVCGCVVLEGVLRLTASKVGEGGYYRFNIVGEGCSWRKCADVAIASMMEEWSGVFTPETIEDSWKAEGAIVRFLPVWRGAGEGQENYVGRILPENYHPFIHLGSLLGEIFAKAGYAIESEFLDSDFFQSLYMSGRWSEREYGSWRSAMNFLASRNEDSPVVQADYGGRVFASPLKNYHTVGNLVDVPISRLDGLPYEECFGLDESTGCIRFTPTTTLMAAFDYHLRWRTQFRIKSRTELVGLSEITLGVGDKVKIPLKNNFVALSAEQVVEGGEYAFVVFDATEGTTYRLVADEIVNPTANPDNLAPGDTVTRVLITTSARMAHFTNNHKGRLCNMRVEMVYEGNVFSYMGDWAVYDGFVQEYGTVELEARVRSKAAKCSPSSPVYFNQFLFGGGEEGMELELLAGSTIRPILYPHPTIGSTLAWRDVADIPQTGMDLIVALQELFDLQIVTDNTSQVVFVEPRCEFWSDRVVDWSELIDPSKPVVVEEVGLGHPRSLRLAYQTGDVAVDEYGKESGIRYGEWRADLLNIFASEGERSLVNNLFTASLSKSGVVAEAPSAHLIVAANGSGSGCVENLNFPAKLVAFRGVRSLPSDQRWSYPTTADGGEYPLLTFFDDGSLAGEPCSLLFEDRDGVEGLHRWWDGYLAELNHSRRLTLHLHLAPEQIEALANPANRERGFGALYRLRVEGEEVLCRLEEICDYNPAESSTKALFVTI